MPASAEVASNLSGGVKVAGFDPGGVETILHDPPDGVWGNTKVLRLITPRSLHISGALLSTTGGHEQSATTTVSG